MAAATTLAKVLRGGRSGLPFELLPAIGRLVPHEGMPNPAVGMGRLMHTGQRRNPVLSAGDGGIKEPRKMEQFCSKRFLRWERDDAVHPPDHPITSVGVVAFAATVMSVIITLPSLYRSAKSIFRVYE